MTLSILLISFFISFISPILCFTSCPLLGPAFPSFTLNTTDSTISAALKKLTRGFDTLVNTTTGTHGDISPNTTFSITLFSSDNGNAKDEPFFWQYHHTAPALQESSHESQTAYQNSIYRIGGLTEVFTVWCLLIAEDGGRIFNDPVTKYLPELLDATSDQDSIEHVRWGDVTIGQLASHMSGIARDYCSSDVTLQAAPLGLGLPLLQATHKSCCDDSTKCSTSDFIRHIAAQTPVAQAGVTPSYSNMAFQLLGYIIERQTGNSYSEALQQSILTPLNMTSTTIFAPNNSSEGIIPINKQASGWSTHGSSKEASTALFTTPKDLSKAARAILSSTLLPAPNTNTWLKPVSHTSNPANSLGNPWIIYSAGNYPNTSMVDIYTVLSNEDPKESLYSSYLGLVPSLGVGFAILSADTEKPADLNAHADLIGDVVLEALMEVSAEQALTNFGGLYVDSSAALNSSIVLGVDELPGLFIRSFVSNGTDFRATLAGILGFASPADLSIRLYPVQLVEGSRSGSRMELRAVFQDVTELADAGTPTCVSWLNLDKLRYGGRALDEFVFELDLKKRATLPPSKGCNVITVSPAPGNTIMPSKELPFLHLIQHLQAGNPLLLLLTNPLLPDKFNISRRLAVLKSVLSEPTALRFERCIPMQRLELDTARRKIRNHDLAERIIWPNRLIENESQGGSFFGIYSTKETRRKKRNYLLRLNWRQVDETAL
ncbi:uncharacterized protein N7511_004885 [Penicillium nucicola]|uniref:uncharacterized protein n=1 Tax=Penicillium nucicola TaxID=1850975 RepID=UPI002545B2E2|nr:uncharacterized protein N7511_004885 [Penicillium nucicola]KAJ5767269.1 hypothetical protein N7511_004885 [Penicillium nucicola]